MNFICEGVDRLGKDSLIAGIKNALGFAIVLHRTKPEILQHYDNESRRLNVNPMLLYQRDCFAQDMAFIKASELHDYRFIFNRSWIGEAVYAKMYRGYSGDYVFDLEKIAGIDTVKNTRLILLTEDFISSNHFVDDGLSLGTSDKRAHEQHLFTAAFNRSLIADKKIICVTGVDGKFRPKEDILKEALE